MTTTGQEVSPEQPAGLMHAARGARPRRLSLALAGLLLAGLPSVASAQDAPPVSPPTRDELSPRPTQPTDRRATTLTIDGEMARSPCALDNPDFADIRVTLQAVRFAGADAASDVSLAPAYQPYLGRELPISVLCDIRARATAILADAGYLAAVEIPEQRLTGGTAEFRVILGRLTALRVRGDAGPSERLLAGYLQPLVGQEVFNTREAERALLLASDIPGLDVRLSLRPAASGAPGDLIGEVAVLRRRAAVDVNLHNYGSRAVGRFGGLVRGEVYDITGAGDRTSISLYSTLDFEEQQTLQLAHDFFVGANGLMLGGQLTLGWTDPDLGLTGFDLKSETLFGTLSATYPILRTQRSSIYSEVGLDLVDQDVTVNGVTLARDRVRTAFARLSFVETDLDSIARRNGYTPYEPRVRGAVSVELRQGLDILGASRDCRGAAAFGCIASGEVPSRIEQDPTPFLLRGEFRGEYRPVPIVTLALDVEGQISNDPLPAFEEVAFGNYSIGRGYDPGAIVGDRGVGIRFEMGYGSLVPDRPDSFALQPYVFGDYAMVDDRDPSQRALGSDDLASLGGGLRFAHGSVLQGDLSIAVPLEATDAQTGRGDVRVLFSLTSRLIPWRF